MQDFCGLFIHFCTQRVIINMMGIEKHSRKNPHNRRYEHSERAMQSAILKLLKRHRGRITARQVAKAAGLSRQTIYNHHPSINQAIINNEAALLQEFLSGLDDQLRLLSRTTANPNGRIFYAILIFMARHREVFCPICADRNNQGLLYKIVEAAYPRLEITWLPVGVPAPEAGSERVEAYIHKGVGIIRRWGEDTGCDVRRGSRCVNSLLRTTEDSARGRLM